MNIHEHLQKLFERDDARGLDEFITHNPEIRQAIEKSSANAFGGKWVSCVRSREMLDVVLKHGADINAKSDWWAGGFGLLHLAPLELCEYAVERGAHVDIHAAARMDLMNRARAILDAEPGAVRACGGDGQTPLHFARSIPMAELLLDRGADMDARDVDHESTPVEYMLDGRVEVARFLVQRGAKTDLLTATALGNAGWVKSHLSADPGCIRRQVSPEWYPMIGGRSGGTILQWNLGWYVMAPQVAKKFGHPDLCARLLARSPKPLRAIQAAWLHDEALVDSLIGTSTGLRGEFAKSDHDQLAHAARNNDPEAVRLMLKLGLGVDGRSQHGATPLHWAAWHGNVGMVESILPLRPDLEDRANDFNGPPLGWAEHGSNNGWHRQSGNYPEVLRILRQALASCLSPGADLASK